MLPAGDRWGFGGWQEESKERSLASCLHYRYTITLTLAAQECKRLGRPRPSQSVDLWRFMFPNKWHDDGFKKFKKRFRIENKDSETILREFTRPMKDKGRVLHFSLCSPWVCSIFPWHFGYFKTKVAFSGRRCLTTQTVPEPVICNL